MTDEELLNLLPQVIAEVEARTGKTLTPEMVAKLQEEAMEVIKSGAHLSADARATHVYVPCANAAIVRSVGSVIDWGSCGCCDIPFPD